MPVNDPILLNAYAQMAEQAYLNRPGDTPNVQFGTSTYAEIGQVLNQPLGFQARAFYNAQLNEVVIAYAGTEGAPGNAFGGFDALEFLQDLTTNVGVGTIGDGFQINNAVDFANDSFDEPELVGVPPFNLTLVGHSLGGFLAQSASLQGFGPNNQRADNVVVFNSPGVGGFAQLPVVGALPEDSYTYVYSPSDTWSSLAGTIHSVGYQLSDNLFVVEDAVDHAIATTGGIPAGISDALTDDPLTTSAVNPIDLAEDPFEFASTNEILQGIVAAVGLLSIQEALELGLDIDAIEDQLDMADAAITGTNGSEVLNGTAGNDVIDALGGNDTINGGTGDDVINGGDGADVIDGGAGNDEIFGGNQYDTITAGAGNDTVWGGNGRDVVYLNQGNDIFNDNGQTGVHSHDTVYAGFGNDTLFGGGGNDVLNGSYGNDFVLGGIGNDLIDGGEGNDVLEGQDGHDTIYGLGGDDTLIGGAGNDYLNGLTGDDRVYGGAGNDTIGSSVDNDVINGGADADRFDFFASQNLGNDRILDFENGLDRLAFWIVDYDDLTIQNVSGGVRISWTDGNSGDADGNDTSSVTLDGLVKTQITVDDFTFF